jgi:hypothetical protein
VTVNDEVREVFVVSTVNEPAKTSVFPSTNLTDELGANTYVIVDALDGSAVTSANAESAAA